MAQNTGLIYYPFPWVSSISPNYGMSGKIVQLIGQAVNTEALKFSHPGDPDMVSTSLVRFGTSLCTYSLDLTNAVPAVYDVTVTANTCPRILKQAFTVLSPLNQPVAWTVNDLGAAGTKIAVDDSCGLVIGDADQDNSQKLYIGNGDTALFQLKKYSSGWGLPSALPAPAGNFSHMLITDGDCDQNWEIYCTSLNNHLIQFKGPAWSSLDLGADNSGSTKINAMATADMDHDGYNEIYTAGNIVNGVICQFRNTGTAWARTVISGSAGTGQTLALAIGDGKNDGNLEIYGGNSDQKIYQYKLSNKIWQVSSLGAGSGMINGVAIGDGDNDGQREVYAACQDGKIFQFRWNGSWSSTPIGNVGGGAMNAVAVSDADNDGSNEVYAVCQDGHAYMYKKIGASWTTVDLGVAGTPLLAMAVGDADNDHHFEVYALGQNNHVHEFKAEASQPVQTPTPVFTAASIPPGNFFKIYRNQVNPNRGESAVVRWSQPRDAPVTITVYNMVGDKIITLVDHQTFSANQFNEVTWKGVNSAGRVVGSGIYIVYFKTDGYETYGKCAVIK